MPHDSTLLECIFNISVAIAHESATKQTKIFKVSSVKKSDIFRPFIDAYDSQFLLLVDI